MTVEEELRQTDTEITKLKIQFDLYFIGAAPKPPTDQRDALEKQLKKMQFNLKNAGDRFLYNSIVNKFNAYSELWLKTLRVKEEGVHLHPIARRAARHAAASSAAAGGSAGTRASAPAHHPARRRGTGRPGPEAESWQISATNRDEAALRNLYRSFIAAKDRVGDSKKPSFEAFAREIGRHAAAIKGQADCDTIDFRIYSSDKKVSLKAKPLK